MCRSAAFISSCSCSWSPEKPRATKLASMATASATGFNGSVSTPNGWVPVTMPSVGGRRRLPLGQAVDLVVVDEERDVHVAAHGVQEVVAALAVAVAVAGDGQDAHVVVDQPDRLCYRQRAAVQPVEGVAAGVVREFAAWPMPETMVSSCGSRPSSTMASLKSLQDLQVAAPGAPGGLLATEFFQLRHRRLP